MLIAGGEHGPGRHPASTDAGEEALASDDSQVGDGVGGPAGAQMAARTVAISTLDALTFEPGAIDVSAGEVVTFTVTNPGQAVHEFTLGDAAMQAQHAEAMAHMPDGTAHELPNSITVQPGETKQLTWRFGDTAVEFGCHEPGHYEAGMRGRIAVT
ncbi:MAG: copper-binding protein [Chloroflexi bacterium]|nr:copper-binding protein [Chloroflexota bacterium]MBA3796040.1 copper-binding protein [Chloroflexota bacterium]